MRQTWLMSSPAARPRRRRSALGLCAAVLLTLIAVALTVPPGFAPLDGRHPSSGIVAPDVPAVAAYLLIAIVALLVGVWIALQVAGVRARARSRAAGAPTWVQLAIVVLALLLPTVVERGDGLFDRAPASDATTQQEPVAEQDRTAAQRSRALGVAVTVLLAVVLAGIVAALTWLFWPVRNAAPTAGPEPELIEGLDAAIDDLEHIREPRRAVVACYVRMEQMLARAGTKRSPSETPVELLDRVLAAHSVAAPNARSLTRLFELARFSPHRIDEAMRLNALSSVRSLRRQLAAQE
jgi:hypothetical protein